jgi:hypothetical protein
MALTPWAQIAGDAPQAIIPGVAPEAAPPNVQPMQSSAEAPVLPPPPAAHGPSPLDQQIAHDQARLEKIRWQQDNPYGTKNNHPGTLGKIAHVLSVAGNIGGDIFAPNVMANIPGTELNRQAQGGALVKRLNEEQQEESQNEQRDALTGKTQEETSEMPQEASDKHALSGATTEHEQAATDVLQHPQPNLAQAYAHAVNAAIQKGGDPSTDPVVQHLADAITSLQPQKAGAMGQPKPVQVNGKSQFAIETPNGWVDAQTHQPIQGNVVPIPPQPNYGELILPTKTQTVLDNGVPTIMQWNEKTQSYDKPLGQSATGGYGHEEAQAGAVQRAGANLIQVLEQNRTKLGTLGAWVSKYGLNTPIADPELAGIQAQMASFAALNPAMHGARGLHAMEHFEKLIGGLQQNPDASIAGIRGIIQTAGAINPGLQKPETGGMIRAIDPQGKLHEAPAGTPLPKGWKLQ